MTRRKMFPRSIRYFQSVIFLTNYNRVAYNIYLLYRICIQPWIFDLRIVGLLKTMLFCLFFFFFDASGRFRNSHEYVPETVPRGHVRRNEKSAPVGPFQTRFRNLSYARGEAGEVGLRSKSRTAHLSSHASTRPHSIHTLGRSLSEKRPFDSLCLLNVLSIYFFSPLDFFLFFLTLTGFFFRLSVNY